MPPTIPEIKNAFDVKRVTLTSRYSKGNTRLLSFEAILKKHLLKKEMQVALENTSAHRIAEASPHDEVWGIGLNAFDPPVGPPSLWLG